MPGGGVCEEVSPVWWEIQNNIQIKVKMISNKYEFELNILSLLLARMLFLFKRRQTKVKKL